MHSIGLICLKNKLNIEFVLAKIEYYLNEDESFKYIFRPYYHVIDLLSGDDSFQGIPGLNLDLRKEEYIRDDRIPTFISERVPGENREDYFELLNEAGLEYMDPIKYLINTKLRYSGDNLYVKEYGDKKDIIVEDISSKNNNYGLLKTIIDSLAKGDNVYFIDGTSLNDISIYKTLMFLYERSYKENQDSKIELAKQAGKYKGRKPKDVDMLKYYEFEDMVSTGKINVKDAASKLGISIDKYYRLRKQLK